MSRFTRISALLITAFLFAVSFLGGLLAQTPGMHAETYQVYRERLLSAFMVSSPGNEPGTGIPASLRHADQGLMYWGDATINLSNWMAVLATEYRLLKDSEEKVESTVEELHRALLAKERLDASAPVFFGSPNREALPDGFFIRDDVPESFTRDWSLHQPALQAFPDVKSDYTYPNIRVNEMSQDQVWNLIIGLSLVVRLVDDTTTWQLPDYHGWQRYTLRERAMLTGFRIIAALQDEVCIRPLPFRDQEFCLPYWHLRNPYTGESVFRGSGPNLLKFGFAEAGNVITGHAYGSMHWANSRHGRIWFSLSAGLQYLQRLGRDGSIERMYHAAATATVGHVWSTRQLVRLFNRNRSYFFMPNHQYEHLALISCILHGDCPPMLQREKAMYEHLLETAPRHGPFNYGDSDASVRHEGADYPHLDEYHHEWSSMNRFVWPQRRGDGTPEYFRGEYNGLDFMLLHNLFYLVYGKY